MLYYNGNAYIMKKVQKFCIKNDVVDQKNEIKRR